jgi:hypothetical protein
MKSASQVSLLARPAVVALLGFAALSPWEMPLAEAQVPPASSGAASASPSGAASSAPSGAASAGAAEDRKQGVAISAYAWPTDPSAEPKEEEWAGATGLETMTGTVGRPGWSSDLDKVACTQRAVREWLRVTCTPPHDAPDNESDVLFGVIWGMAGDVSSVKGSFTMASELERYSKMAPGIHKDMFLKMASSATVTFQIKQGSALILSLDRIGWAFSYYGDSDVFSQQGLRIDVSWALGEKHPTINYM